MNIKKEDLTCDSIYKSSENTCFGYEFVVITDMAEQDFLIQKEEVAEVKYFTIEEIEEAFNSKNSEFTFTKWKGTELLDKAKMLKNIRENICKQIK